MGADALNGSTIRWDIVILGSVAMLCITIASFHDETFTAAASGIGGVVSTVIVGLLNQRGIAETKEKVAENTAITEHTASVTEQTASNVEDLKKKSGT